MDRVLIYDVAAESGGGLEILNKYYDLCSKNSNCLYFFVTSIVSLKETNNIKNIRIPWVKKSWIHRLYCDLFYVKKLIKLRNINRILSLQNIAVKSDIRQAVYVQNVIPYSRLKFSFFSEFRLWVQKNFIGAVARKSLKRPSVDKIIVQSQWMKKTVSETLGIDEGKIVVEKVGYDLQFSETERIESTGKVTFFYPATPFVYKNHFAIIEACKSLIESGESDFEIVFTFSGNENALAKRIKKYIKRQNLPIVLVGFLSKDKMYDYYKKSVLVFPSKLETVGLPLLEAKSFWSEIIAIDSDYSREAIGTYKKCSFFDSDDEGALFDAMKKVLGERHG